MPRETIARPPLAAQTQHPLSGLCLCEKGKLGPKLLIESPVGLMVLVRTHGLQDQHPLLGRETGPLLGEREDA